VLELVCRYLILIILGIFINLFYIIFTPLTVYPVLWVLSIIDSGTRLVTTNSIFFLGEYIELVGACIAGAAYYLLIIFNLVTPMKITKRIYSIVFMFGIFWILNILRILLFSVLWVYGFEYFSFTHKLTWYFGSTILVVFIWFITVWLFNIRNIPVYSDFVNLFSDMFKDKAKKRK